MLLACPAATQRHLLSASTSLRHSSQLQRSAQQQLLSDRPNLLCDAGSSKLADPAPVLQWQNSLPPQAGQPLTLCVTHTDTLCDRRLVGGAEPAATAQRRRLLRLEGQGRQHGALCRGAQSPCAGASTRTTASECTCCLCRASALRALYARAASRALVQLSRCCGRWQRCVRAV